MFGKLSAIANYQKIWDVYIVKRFPSNRISMWGMGFSYLVALWFAQRMLISHREKSLKRLRLQGKSSWMKCPISRFWCFNPTYVR
jgi:hypothetical protein